MQDNPMVEQTLRISALELALKIVLRRMERDDPQFTARLIQDLREENEKLKTAFADKDPALGEKMSANLQNAIGINLGS